VGTYLPQWVVITVLLALVGLLIYLIGWNLDGNYPVVLVLGGLIGGILGVDRALRKNNAEDEK
jgi:hypothetical protein